MNDIIIETKETLKEAVLNAIETKDLTDLFYMNENYDIIFRKKWHTILSDKKEYLEKELTDLLYSQTLELLKEYTSALENYTITDLDAEISLLLEPIINDPEEYPNNPEELYDALTFTDNFKFDLHEILQFVLSL